MSERIWVLGAPDPEMEAIERLLRECGERVVYATHPDGARVTPATAYRCTVPEVPEGATVYAVECLGVLPDGWVRIDHHRPGDPGYGRPPSEFLAASSIGQVIAELAKRGRLPESWDTIDGPLDEPGVFVFEARDIGEPAEWMVVIEAHAFSAEDGGEPDFDCATCAIIPRDLVLTAAADHCLGAAYAGECPGVDPDALMRWRAESRARFQGRPVEEVLADVELARDALLRAPELLLAPLYSPRCTCGGVGDCVGCTMHPDYVGRDLTVRDMRDAYTVRTVLVEPFVDGATVDAAGVGDSVTTEFGAREEGVWDEGGHHTFVRRGAPELPDAASRDGEAYLATVTDGAGRSKIVLGGATTPEMVRAFLDHWAPSQGLVDAYGDPERGFAGAYLPEEETETADDYSRRKPETRLGGAWSRRSRGD